MKARKTITIEHLKEFANQRMARKELSPEARDATFWFAYALITEANQYMGYHYIGWQNGGYQRWVADGQPKDTLPYIGDETMKAFI